MRKSRIVAVVVAAVVMIGTGVGSASAKPYHMKSESRAVQAARSITGR